MEGTLIFILFLAFFIRTIRNSLYQVFLWQLKEYRFDRMWTHLKTWQGRRMVLGPMSLAKFGLIGAYFLGLPIFWLTLPLYLLEATLNIKEMISNFKKPVFTLKASFVAGLVIIGQLGGFWVLGNWSNFSNLAMVMLVLDKLLAPATAAIILFLAIPTAIQRLAVIEDAKIKLAQHPNLITIGITGSYGKTSTKEFLASILSHKFKVLKTLGSNNTDIGVAKTIVENLKDQQIFVCEMAAYKVGEIKAICDIVKPKIGIITAINEQHLELFGSLENTMKAKFELIEALPKNGLAIFNGNNQYTRQLAERARKKQLITVIYQYANPQQSEKANFLASGIKVLPNRLEFEIQVGKEKIETYAPLLGAQNIENIMAAVVVASRLGMNLRDIAQAIKSLQAPEMTMKPYKGPAGSTLIDDTFNANPDGVLAAISYMKLFSGKKILVFQPMIELGEEDSRLHQEVGETAAKVCDQIYLTNKNFYESISQGAALINNGLGKIFLLAPDKVAGIKDNLTRDDVVVFEGKEAAKILNKLL